MESIDTNYVPTDWNSLIFGTYNAAQVQRAISESRWQEYRANMLGTSLRSKYIALKDWLEDSEYSDAAKIQVTNYVNALKRGGLIVTK